MDYKKYYQISLGFLGLGLLSIVGIKQLSNNLINADSQNSSKKIIHLVNERNKAVISDQTTQAIILSPGTKIPNWNYGNLFKDLSY